MPYDIFTEQPIKGMIHPASPQPEKGHPDYALTPCKGARAYLFKAVCHDFTDHQCAEFLNNTTQAMNSTSSLLLDDWVLPDVEAPVLGASENIMMMMLFASQERSLGQSQSILGSIGLKIVNVWRSQRARESVIEAKLISG